MAVLALSITPAQPSYAHGALWNPISRAAACAPDNERYSDSPACVAAQNATPGGALDAWDNLRRKDVNGDHRSAVPDGQLCGAGLEAYRGLNLPRKDWPATHLHEGSLHTFKFLATIPHKGRFTLYITKDDYDPMEPLRWSDLESEPFADVTDPELIDSAYQFESRLPSGKKGRHVIFTIWENTTLPDTYYFCSDILFWGGRDTLSERPSPGAATKGIGVAVGGRPTPSTPTPKSTRPVTPQAQSSPTALASVARVPGDGQGRMAVVLAGMLTTAAAAVVLVLSFFIWRQSRRRA
ncbi:lytic polysaccharide monooxygenase [Streptomyces sp. NPDC057430]|uniref:lytic polysaccharide monooxygenase auxiliary activity family 9 protein n=1 Tax=Streptomyces sp. NPDC057430 TaxID=3346131 RepID=UPI0036C327FB